MTCVQLGLSLENPAAFWAATKLIGSKPAKKAANYRSWHRASNAGNRSTNDAKATAKPCTSAGSGGSRSTASDEALCVVGLELMLTALIRAYYFSHEVISFRVVCCE